MNPRNAGRNQYQSKPETVALARSIAAQPATCQGCFFLQVHPRPQCKGEASPYYRTARETYHPRCAVHAYRSPNAPEPVLAPASRFAIAGNATKGRRRAQG